MGENQLSKKWTGITIITFFSVIFMLFMPGSNEMAFAEVEDGTYEIHYEIIHAETESASIANDYFEKPAILFHKDGESYIRFTVNHSDWIQEIQTPLADDFVDVEVKSEDAEEDMRDVVFKVEQDDLSEPIMFKMHVIVKEIDPPIDSHYTARFAFDADSLEPIEEAEYDENELMTSGNQEDTAEEMPADETAAMEKEAESKIDETETKEDGTETVVDSDDENMSGILVGIIAAISIILIVLLWKILTRKKSKGE